MINLMSDQELQGLPCGEVFVFDVETYPNFFFIAFKSLSNGKFVTFEHSPDAQINTDKLNWMLYRYCFVGFNSANYDIPMIELSKHTNDNQKLKEASDFIIKSGPAYNNKKITAYDFFKNFKITAPNYNHIDLFNVCPVNGGLTAMPASLKLYAGRMHAPRMQDLPYPENHVLTREEGEAVRLYCCNDLDNTELLYKKLLPEIKLRYEMSSKYGIDLRSKSDAQIAEAVINNELEKVLGRYPKKPVVDQDADLKYNIPDFVNFKTNELKEVLACIDLCVFQLDVMGSPLMPALLENLEIKLGKSRYKLGKGGLHSKESKIAHTNENGKFIIADNDVESFYPRIILNQKLYPPHLGEAFLTVYENIVSTRIDAKRKASVAKKEKDKEGAKHWKVIADSLKIVINGSFGKLGNKYSTLYSPQSMLQVTITGQLVLLMLIERLEEIGVSVISGNTDGIVCKYEKERHSEVREVIAQWEKDTQFKTEETQYTAIYSRDVNSYIALKDECDPDSSFLDEQLGIKTKGEYSERGSALNSILSKNPEAFVCTDAVLQFVKSGIPIEKTIKECQDIRRFVFIKNVRGGAVKDGQYLGKVVRWYYPTEGTGKIEYKTSGNKVANSDGAKPLMDLPDIFPNDIDYQRYIDIADKMLYECGAKVKKEKASLLRLL